MNHSIQDRVNAENVFHQALELVAIPSPTGDSHAVAEYYAQPACASWASKFCLMRMSPARPV